MTLYRQILTAVLAVLLLLYIGNLVVSLKNTRSLVGQQMRNHAQDAATSLALSMTQAAQNEDLATLETLVNAVSDSGYYRRIEYFDADGSSLLAKEFSVTQEGVPQWFIRLMSLPDYEGVAEVASGWVILGTLKVVSHPGQAYKQLWQAAAGHLLWFTLIGVGASVAIFFSLGVVLSPLRDVEKQAEAIARQQFTRQSKLPKTRELRRVVEVMNRLSARLEDLFHSQSGLIAELRELSHSDLVTGLSNRVDFDARLNSFASDDSSSRCGALMIFALNHLSRINELGGRRAGNEMLQSLANTLKQGVEQVEPVILARRQGQEFALFVPDLDEDTAVALADSLVQAVSGLTWRHQDELPLNITMGFTYSDKILNGPELLSEADIALNSVDVDGGESWCKFSSLDIAGIPTLSEPTFDAREFVTDAIANKAIELRVQKTVSVPEQHTLGYEVYSRFQAPDDFELTAATVMPMVQRFGLSVDLDKLVLEKLAEMNPSSDAPLSVNICPGSVNDPGFCRWVDEFLSARRDFARRLVVEVPEHALKVAEANIRSFANILARYDSGLAVDHFGLESSAFGYLASLPLRYLKVHRSFVKNLNLSRDNQFYIKALLQLAQTREVRLFVEGVETESEWQALVGLNIDGAQGYWIANPEELS